VSVSSIELDRVPSCVALARAFVVSNVAGWGFLDGWAELELLTSEVVTNAFRHARGAIHLSVARSDSSPTTVRVEVADHDRRPPVVWTGRPTSSADGACA
jgi:anti-sigma regulatory factor (Ser/Thr protein kinase)